MRSLNILHWMDLWWREIGGPIRSVSDLAEAMRQRGHRVTIATADDRDIPDEWRVGEGPTVARLRHGRFGSLDRASRVRMRELVATADVLHLSGVWERSSAMVASIARSLGKPYVISPRGVLDDWSMGQGGLKKRLYLALVSARMVQAASAVHCTAAGEASQVERRVHGSRTQVIPNLLRLDALHALPRAESAAPRILFLARVHPKKGLERLLEALARIDSDPTPILEVAGEGDPKEVARIERRIAELGLGDRVRFHGHLDADARLELMSRSWMMALPTSQENFGNALFESLAAGLPVITSDDLDTAPELADSGGAILVSRSPKAIADSISALLADPKRRRELGERGRQWTRAFMDPSAIADRYESMYLQAASAALDG